MNSKHIFKILSEILSKQTSKEHKKKPEITILYVTSPEKKWPFQPRGKQKQT